MEKPNKLLSSPITSSVVKTLQEEMLRGIVATQKALFSQAESENIRLGSMRDALSFLEKDIFDPTFIDQLNSKQRFQLYRVLLENKQMTLEFLSNLNNNLSMSIESLTHLRKLEESKGDSKEDATVSIFKQELLKAIEEKKNKT